MLSLEGVQPIYVIVVLRVGEKELTEDKDFENWKKEEEREDKKGGWEGEMGGCDRREYKKSREAVISKKVPKKGDWRAWSMDHLMTLILYNNHFGSWPDEF